MRPLHRLTACAACGLLLASVPAAGGGVGLDPASSINAFAVDLHKHLARDDGNVFFSPASVVIALAMTREGAAGATAAEMDRVLHLPAGAAGRAEAFGRLGEQLAADRDGEELTLVNRLFGQRDLPFRTAFLATLESRFGAGLDQVDFRADPDGSRLHINNWVAGQTRDRIRDLLGPGAITPATALVLVNAVHFLGAWRTPFPVDATADAPFHLADGGAVQAPFMRVQERFGYGEVDGVQVLSLPYKGQGLDMVLVLPPQDMPLADLERRMAADTMAAWLAAPATEQVNVVLPRVHLESSFLLNDQLKALGMPRAFTGQAEFPGMIEGGGLFISQVVHKSFLDVDEKGTEAAAATGVIVSRTSVSPQRPRSFVADRPFLLAIRHRDSGALLFLGRVADPTR